MQAVLAALGAGGAQSEALPAASTERNWTTRVPVVVNVTDDPVFAVP